jgi:hypothetical protein
MYPQHGKDIAVAIGVLTLQGKLCSHRSAGKLRSWIRWLLNWEA